MRRLRVLHVVGGLSRGGAETWLLHLARRIDRERFQLDFLVHTSAECAYDSAIRALGSRILVCPDPRRPWSYARNLKQLLREEGPFDIVHSHVHHYSGCVLRVAARGGVPVRIAHSHNDTSRHQADASLSRRIYLALTERWIRSYSTAGLAASSEAARSLFGSRWRDDPRWRLHYCSIDLGPFERRADRSVVRRELGIPPDCPVIGHVGSFTAQKNHTFLIEIAAELLRGEPEARVLLVGEGPLRGAIETQVRAAGLGDRVVFAGARPDVPRLLTGAVDVFVLPSRYEGLPVVLLEAQAAGLPSVVSDVVTTEGDVVRSLIERRSLSEPAANWAAVIRRNLREPPAVAPDAALAEMRDSPFDIIRGARLIQEIYATLSTAAHTSAGARKSVTALSTTEP